MHFAPWEWYSAGGLQYASNALSTSELPVGDSYASEITGTGTRIRSETIVRSMGTNRHGGDVQPSPEELLRAVDAEGKLKRVESPQSRAHLMRDTRRHQRQRSAGLYPGGHLRVGKSFLRDSAN